MPTKKYADHLKRARERQRQQTIAGQDIGAIPAIEKPSRRKRAVQSFRSFCESYFPDRFSRDWSPDHLRVIAKIETAVRRGGLFAMAMPRGSGKTTLVEAACLWALLIGSREFVVLIGSDEASAVSMLDSIKMELGCNELLAGDFPRAVYPIQQLDNSARRAEGQRYLGKKTYIGWRAKEIVFPTIPKCRASGAIVRVTGLTGHFRGMKFTRPDGKTVRPSLVILDDPQTDESARSPTQCAYRESLVAGAVLGLAGPGEKLAGLMPCTVIFPGDMADSILDREKHPEWNGERTKMVYAWPINEKWWTEDYAKVRADSLRAGHGGKEATTFYRRNRRAADAGSEVGWEARYNSDELSAIQHAWNLRLERGDAAFFAEFQNEPIDETQAADLLTADQIAGKQNGLKRGEVPVEADILSAMIDVHKHVLYWMVMAWQPNFAGYVIDYGTYPDQGRPYFALTDAKHTLERAAPQATGMEGWIYAGLETLTQSLLGRVWERDDGLHLRIDRCLIDANWGQARDLVYNFVRHSQFSRVITPSHGKFVGASSKPFGEYERKPGDRLGLNWRQPYSRKTREIRHTTFDANFWKSFGHARLAVAMGQAGCVSLWGGGDHRMFADHLVAEYPIRTEGRGRVVDEWKPRPGEPDNHFLDCYVGCMVAASMCGVQLAGLDRAKVRQKKRVKLSELQQRRRSKQ